LHIVLQLQLSLRNADIEETSTILWHSHYEHSPKCWQNWTCVADCAVCTVWVYRYRLCFRVGI